MCGAPPDELALLRERNRLLAEQVAQMQRMLTAGNMLQRSMVRLVGGTAGIGHEEFMQRFPLPPNEAERRLALRASGVMAIGVHKGCVGRERVAELVTRMAQSEALAPDVLGSELVGVLVTLMDADTQRLLVALAKDETSGGFTAADLRRPLALPRKCTKCQHVIASGDVVCVKGGMKGVAGRPRRRRLRRVPAFRSSYRPSSSPTTPSMRPPRWVSRSQSMSGPKRSAIPIPIGSASCGPLAIVTSTLARPYSCTATSLAHSAPTPPASEGKARRLWQMSAW